MFYKICIFVIMTLPLTALSAASMPCEAITSELKEDLSYYSEKQTPEFMRCISKYRVCAVADRHVIYATNIQSIKSNYEATTLVIVQSPAEDDAPVCLVGVYSGGSAAAWAFKAYKVVNGEATAYHEMEEASAQGDAVAPKDAAIVTYQMFEKYVGK